MKPLYKAFLAFLTCAAAFACGAAEPTGETMGHTCAACHGTYGDVRNEAFVPLAGMNRKTFIDSMLAYKNLMRPSSIMSHIADGYTSEEIGRMADFFAKQPRSVLQPRLAPETGAAKGGSR